MMDPTERETYIRALLPRVRSLARRLKRIVPHLDVDDLTGDGFVGLIRAVDSFDPARGPQIDEYARRLIVGAMLNGIRRMDPVSERARRIVRDGENERYTLAASSGETPTLTEMERRRPGYQRALTAAHRGQPLSLDAPLPIGDSLSGDALFQRPLAPSGRKSDGDFAAARLATSSQRDRTAQTSVASFVVTRR